jgi:glycosyltransferase involved in cell wall biosynthesis
MTAGKPEVLVCADYFVPGYKAGGPIRTLANMIEQLGDEFCFKIVTRDRDLGDTEPYPNIVINEWQPVSKAEVFYLAPDKLKLKPLRCLFFSTRFDLLYLNSFFSFRLSILPLVCRAIGAARRKPTILAPRGEFSSGALALKRFRKRAFLASSKRIGLYSGITWQASSEYEKENIQGCFGKEAVILVAPDLPPLVLGTDQEFGTKKKKKHLKLLFLSRISKMKNLIGALGIIKEIKGEVVFHIFGPIEDLNYWSECKKQIHEMPQNIKIEYRGSVEYPDVHSVMRDYDFFFLPTLGENFGHVILEALVAGCPVVISDQTPWRGLADKGVGWDLPLGEPGDFRKVLQQCVDMDDIAYRSLAQRARDFGVQCSHNQEILQRNRALFCTALRI